MKWIKVDAYAVRSEPPGYWINLAVMGGTVAYTAVRAGTGQGPEILHVERGLPAGDRQARDEAFKACARRCEEVAARGV